MGFEVVGVRVGHAEEGEFVVGLRVGLPEVGLAVGHADDGFAVGHTLDGAIVAGDSVGQADVGFVVVGTDVIGARVFRHVSEDRRSEAVNSNVDLFVP